MRIHKLKTVSPHFENVASGLKPYELRKLDRDYQVGDYLILWRYEPEVISHRESIEIVKVTLILKNAPEYGLMAGHGILSIKSASLSEYQTVLKVPESEYLQPIECEDPAVKSLVDIITALGEAVGAVHR